MGTSEVIERQGGAELEARKSGTHLVMRVGAGRVGRLPQNQQRGLVAEPYDELARRIRLWQHTHKQADNIPTHQKESQLTCADKDKKPYWISF